MILGRFGGSWKVFWSSWGVLGDLLEGLGGLLDRLGGVLGGLGGILGALGSQKSFWTQQGPARGQTYVPKGDQDGAQMGAKVCQNRRQNGPKSKTKTKTKKEALEDRLGAVLGRSWVVLGAVLGSFSCSRSSGGYILKNRDFEKRRLQETTWSQSGVDLEAQEAPKWGPKRS